MVDADETDETLTIGADDGVVDGVGRGGLYATNDGSNGGRRCTPNRKKLCPALVGVIVLILLATIIGLAVGLANVAKSNKDNKTTASDYAASSNANEKSLENQTGETTTAPVRPHVVSQSYIQTYSGMDIMAMSSTEKIAGFQSMMEDSLEFYFETDGDGDRDLEVYGEEGKDGPSRRRLLQQLLEQNSIAVRCIVNFQRITSGTATDFLAAEEEATGPITVDDPTRRERRTLLRAGRWTKDGPRRLQDVDTTSGLGGPERTCTSVTDQVQAVYSGASCTLVRGIAENEDILAGWMGNTQGICRHKNMYLAGSPTCVEEIQSKVDSLDALPGCRDTLKSSDLDSFIMMFGRLKSDFESLTEFFCMQGYNSYCYSEVVYLSERCKEDMKSSECTQAMQSYISCECQTGWKDTISKMSEETKKMMGIAATAMAFTESAIEAMGCVGAEQGKDELDAAMIKWNSLQDYEFIFQRSSMLQEFSRPYSVSVRAGIVDAVTFEDAGAGAAMDVERGTDLFNSILTIEDQFGEIQKAIHADAASISVTYDDTLGYPKSIVIDPNKRIADDEIYITNSGMLRNGGQDPEVETATFPKIEGDDTEFGPIGICTGTINDDTGYNLCNPCEGDCDRDTECSEGLVCFQRKGNEPVPNCYGTAQTKTDYCIDPFVAFPENEVDKEEFGPIGICTGKVNDKTGYNLCTLCQGDCDRDRQCSEGLVCFQRMGNERVPGCWGRAHYKKDYCIDPINLDTPVPEPATTEAGSSCIDNSEFCSVWASGGQCDSNPGYMHKQCAKSCGKCGHQGDVCGAAKSQLSAIYSSDACRLVEDIVENQHLMGAVTPAGTYDICSASPSCVEAMQSSIAVIDSTPGCRATLPSDLAAFVASFDQLLADLNIITSFFCTANCYLAIYLYTSCDNMASNDCTLAAEDVACECLTGWSISADKLSTETKGVLGIDDEATVFNDEVIKATGCPDTLNWDDQEEFPQLHLEIAFTMTWTAAESSLFTENGTATTSLLKELNSLPDKFMTYMKSHRGKEQVLRGMVGILGLDIESISDVVAVEAGLHVFGEEGDPPAP